jgi:hypothetical protein
MPGSPPLGLPQAPAWHWIHALLGSLPLRPCQAPAMCWTMPCWDPNPSDPPNLRSTALQALLDPSSMWDDWIHAPPESPPLRAHWAPAPCETTISPAKPGSTPLRLHQATALHACQITAPPGSRSGHHKWAPNLPKRHRQTGLDAKGVTSEQGRLQFYCSRTGDLFFPFLKCLAVWFAV